ncbi:hypothetical protein [Nisaea sp.]|uniref:hypothetical protein n=1 Tax=Nisaea sp. TaxID=2024842 RepID=UPI002B2698B8|nr:hypothetical protein [Nisaea sp.]
MSKNISYCILIVCVGLVLTLASSSPSILSDNNQFLKEFVGQAFLGILGVILAITLASAGQLHLTLNQIEEKYEEKNSFEKTRSGIRQASYWLISLFLFSVGLVVLKSLLAVDEWIQTIFNGFSLIVLIWNVLILITITKAIFHIRPHQD